MTTTITGITADLRLESAAFIRDMAKAAAAVQRNTSAMQRSFVGLQRTADNFAGFAKGFFGGFLTVQGVRALATLGRQAISTADNIGDAANKIGVSAESLQKLRFAAEQAGAGTDELDAALKVFIQNLSAGKIEAVGSTLTEKFTDYLGQIEKAPTFLDKAALAQDAFGKKWQTAIAIVADGVDEFRKNADAATVFSDRATASADKLDKQIRTISQAAQTGFDTGFLEAFAGGLDSAAGKSKTVYDSMKDLGTALGTVASLALSTVDKVAKFLNENRSLLMLMFSPTLGLDLSGANNQPGFRGAGQGASDTANLPKPTGISSHPPGGLINKDAIAAMNEYTNAIGNNSVAIRDWDTEVTDALGRSLEQNDLLREGTNLFASMQTPMEEYASTIQRIDTLLAAGAISADTYARAHQAATLNIADTWLGAAGAISGALAGIFKDNKAVAIANAVINTAEAVTSALKNPPGPPFSFAYAAAAAAAGAAQIATILSTNPGGGSKAIKTPKGGTAVAAAGKASNNSSSGGGRGRQSSVNITVQGDFYSPETMRRVLEGLNGVIADGAKLNVSAG